MHPRIQDLHQRIMAAAGASRWGRLYYELQYRLHPDPWRYRTSPYEQAKYARTLEALPRPHYARALEIGCAEGVFTAQLAPRCNEIVAVDFVGTALERARLRCRHLAHVHFVQMDVLRGGLAGRFDLIICGEVLYYLGQQREIAQLAEQCIGWLNPGGHLLLINPWPAAQRLHTPFHSRPEMRLLDQRHERRVHRPYTITTFERIL